MRPPRWFLVMLGALAVVTVTVIVVARTTRGGEATITASPPRPESDPAQAQVERTLRDWTTAAYNRDFPTMCGLMSSQVAPYATCVRTAAPVKVPAPGSRIDIDSVRVFGSRSVVTYNPGSGC